MQRLFSTECQSHTDNKHDNNPTYSVQILNKYRVQQLEKDNMLFIK